MQDVKANRATANLPSNRILILVLVLTVLVTVAVYVINANRANALPPKASMISQSALEEKYGLRVNLVAVTAAGGFVDVRIKIANGEKAKLLLTDTGNFPALSTEDGVSLNAPEDTRSQEIRFDDNGNLFIMYPNSRNAIQPGTPVTILFGDIALEPINAK